MKRFVAQAQIPAVQPHEVGGIGGVGPDLGDVLFAVVHHEVEVGGNVGQELLQPFLAFIEGHLHGGDGEGVVAVDIHVGPELVEHGLHVSIGEHRGAGLKTCQIEGLGGGNAGDHIGGDLGGEGGGGDVALAVEDEVGMDLVADHQNLVLQTQLHHPAQLLLRPDDAPRIVGVAQQEDVRAPELFLEVGPVHRPCAALLYQLIFNDVPASQLGHVIELTVHGGLDQNIAVLGGIEPDHDAEGLDHAGTEAHEGRVGVPAGAALLPVLHGLEIAGGPGGVAPDALLGPGLQRVNDGLGGPEVHIRDPQGDHIVGAELLDPFIILGGEVFGAVYHLVEIILHDSHILSLRVQWHVCML